MRDPVFTLIQPFARTSCAVFSSPHSGSNYPATFLGRSRLDPLQIRSSEDAFVDELFDCAPRHGAPLLAACAPRAFVDLNRAASDLDPALIEGAPRRFLSPRIAAGLGVIPRVVADGRPIIDGKLPLQEAERRIVEYYHPYHAMLRSLMDESRSSFGFALLVDCHSMPHEAIAAAPLVRGKRPDVVLGDRFGASCDRWLIDAATDIFSEAGFFVARNVPFAGGYITQTYGRPVQGFHALQVELDRALYMDEANIQKRDSFDEVRERIAAAVQKIAALGPREAQVAAE